MDPEAVLSIDEFADFTSPRYFRFVVSDLRPTVKNGDLLAALNELKTEGFFTPETTWEKLVLTDKGKNYTKMVKNLLNLGALNVPQANGLFDYRTEIGRRVICELVRFLAERFDLQDFFQYLNLPVFEPEAGSQEVGLEAELGPDFDYRTEEGQATLMNILHKRTSRKVKKVTDIIRKLLHQSRGPMLFDLRFVRKFLQEKGLKRVEPIFNHFNSVEPKIFEVHERQLSIYLPELMKITEALEDYVDIFMRRDNRWLTEYFSLVNLPTEFFGFSLPGDYPYTSGKDSEDTFLNIAWEGPKLFASQLSTHNNLGDLQIIIFPINASQSVVISCTGILLYYFALPTEQCNLQLTTCLNAPPHHFLISQKQSQFGKLLSHNASSLAAPLEEGDQDQGNEAENVDDPKLWGRGKKDKDKGKLKDKDKAKAAEDEVQRLASSIAAFFSICQLIAQKLTPDYSVPVAFCVFENGSVSVSDFVESNSLLATISTGSVDIGTEIAKILEKIQSSVGSLIGLKGRENP